MILAYPGVKNFKATPRVTTTSPAGAKRYIETPIAQSHLVASYDHAGINGGCNSYAVTLKGKPLSHKGKVHVRYYLF